MDENTLNNLYAGLWYQMPKDTLLDLVRKGEVSLDRITPNNNEQISYLKSIKNDLAQDDEKEWSNAKTEKNTKAYSDYLKKFGETAIHAKEAQAAITRLDNEEWTNTQISASKEAYKEYLEFYPQGNHSAEAKDILDNWPWRSLVVKLENWLDSGENPTKWDIDTCDFENYKQQHPGKHDDEANAYIEVINDEREWAVACANNNDSAYKEYLKKYPTGRHRETARDRIDNKTEEQLFLDRLRDDINSMSAMEIKNKIKSNFSTWDALVKNNIFTEAQIKAIQNYKEPQAPMEIAEPPCKNHTEVYFWGLRGTGKTCAIGATLSYLKYQYLKDGGYWTPTAGKGVSYTNYLTDQIFKGKGICTLPPRTIGNTNVQDNLPIMPFEFTNSRKHRRRVQIIDVAGEVFSGIYKEANGFDLSDGEKSEIRLMVDRLKDDFNHKIHFFIIEYGVNDTKLNVDIDKVGLVSKADLMSSVVQYFSNNKSFKNTTQSMNLLVTKCDKIRETDAKEKENRVAEYIEASNWSLAVRGIKNIASDLGCPEPDTLMFSIGNVFAQHLCELEPKYAKHIVNIIEKYTPYDNLSSVWGKFISKLKS